MMLKEANNCNCDKCDCDNYENCNCNEGDCCSDN